MDPWYKVSVVTFPGWRATIILTGVLCFKLD